MMFKFSQQRFAQTFQGVRREHCVILLTGSTCHTCCVSKCNMRLFYLKTHEPQRHKVNSAFGRREDALGYGDTKLKRFQTRRGFNSGRPCPSPCGRLAAVHSCTGQCNCTCNAQRVVQMDVHHETAIQPFCPRVMPLWWKMISILHVSL